jgi:hypothetical protein
MPFNLLKKYPELLDILHLTPHERTISLKGVFRRDIKDNNSFKFRHKVIRPIKGEEPEMQLMFRHLTTEEVEEVDDSGRKIKKRLFEIDRSRRLHWIRHHIEENKNTNMEFFSVEERIDGRIKIRTYIYDIDEKYVIILEPQRSSMDYYLITAYYLNKAWAVKQMKKKMKKRFGEVL